MKFLKLIILSTLIVSKAFSQEVKCSASSSEWQNFLSRIAQYGANGAYLEDYKENVERCQSDLKSKDWYSCFENFMKYKSRTSSRGRSHSLGFNISDARYIEDRKELLTLPKEFRNGLPANWREIADKKGWKYLEYRSQTVAN